jgi:hypothetical protein
MLVSCLPAWRELMALRTPMLSSPMVVCLADPIRAELTWWLCCVARSRWRLLGYLGRWSRVDDLASLVDRLGRRWLGAERVAGCCFGPQVLVGLRRLSRQHHQLRVSPLIQFVPNDVDDRGLMSSSSSILRTEPTGCGPLTGWVRIQSTAGGATPPLISILVCEKNQRLGAVRVVCFIHQ